MQIENSSLNIMIITILLLFPKMKGFHQGLEFQLRLASLTHKAASEKMHWDVTSAILIAIFRDFLQPL